MDIIEALDFFDPSRFSFADEEESALKEALLQILAKEGDRPFYREREEGHLTASAMILDPELKRVLAVYHNIYRSLSWTGGHADGERDLLAAAVREAKEETGITKVQPYYGGILSLDLLPVPAHEKKGKAIASHRHFSVAYVLIAPFDQPIRIKPDENSAVEWVEIEEFLDRCSEPHMIGVYEKVFARIQEIRQWKEKACQGFAERLVSWYQTASRELPWRKDREPYHVWLSEIMLQQTRVEAVRSYYTRFLEALPDVAALARANRQQLMKLWEGLGYYSRAANLQKSAWIIQEEYGGRFPREYEEILALPGIGEYTAGAISSICFGKPYPAVDGNVLRVFARVTELYENVLQPGVKKAVTGKMQQVYLYNQQLGQDPGALTQALMELGATVCVPGKKPRCQICPVKGLCLANRNGTWKSLPVREKKKEKRQEEMTVFLLEKKGRIALRKRPDRGLLAGLWELPHMPSFLTEQQALDQVKRWGYVPLFLQKALRRQHVFTHIRWDMLCYTIKIEEEADMGPEREDFLWAEKSQLKEQLPLPSAFQLFL